MGWWFGGKGVCLRGSWIWLKTEGFGKYLGHQSSILVTMCVHANHETVFFFRKLRNLMQLCSSVSSINALVFPKNNNDIADERSWKEGQNHADNTAGTWKEAKVWSKEAPALKNVCLRNNKNDLPMGMVLVLTKWQELPSAEKWSL